MRGWSAIAIILFIAYVLCCNENTYAQKRMPIMASHTIRAGHNTLENYKNIEEAGFTLAKEYYPSVDEAIEHLKTASKTKVKLIVECPEFSNDLENSVMRLNKYRSFGGYDISDEPGAESFNELGKKVEKIRRLDDKHIIWLNLFPIYAQLNRLQTDSYNNYVDQYIDLVKPPFVSFDCYAIRKKGLDTDFYRNLELISDKCKKTGLRFWTYVLASQFSDFVEPTKGSISFQAYCNLAYGAQGIEYFSYRRIIQTGLNITISPVDTNYKKMPIYDSVKQLNNEILYYSRFFCDNNVVDVTHLGSNTPEGTSKTTELPNQIKVLEYGEKGFVVSHFMKKNHDYLMFVNKDYNNKQMLKVYSPKRIKRLSYYVNERKSGSGELFFTVQPGSMVLLRL